MTPTLPFKMLDFVLALVLNSGLKDEEMLTVLKLELLDRKLQVLCGILKKMDLTSTEEAFQKFYTMESNLGKELGGVLEGWFEMAGQLREKEPIPGGGSPGTGKFIISRPRGGSSGARDMELRFLQEEEVWYKETEEPKKEVMDTLKPDARSVVNAAWICGHLEEENWRSGSGERQRKTMDRGGVG